MLNEELKIEIEKFPTNEENTEFEYLATMKSLKLVDSGNSPEDAFRELLTSLAVKLHYENGFQFPLLIGK